MKKERNMHSGPWAVTWIRFKRNPLAIAGLVVLGLMVAGVILIPVFSPYEWNQVDGFNRFSPPDKSNWFGTMRNGNDLFVNVWYGGRQSLVYAAMTTSVYVITGTLLGLLSGYFNKYVDAVINHFMDFIHALPLIPILLIAGTTMTMRGIEASGTILYAMLIFGFFSSPVLYKIVRMQVKQLKNLEFMQAANNLGLSGTSRIFRHLMPNVLSHVAVAASLMMSQAILIELLLFFAGIGFSATEFTPLRPTWGNLVPNIRGLTAFRNYYWLSLFPLLAITISTTSFKLIGEGLREALDPKTEQ